MATIRYKTGDATRPEGEGPKVICHCCNNIGGWGSGFVVALSKRWSDPEKAYRMWAKEKFSPQVIPRGANTSGASVAFELGQVIFVEAEPELWVANIIGQHETERTSPLPVRYEAIEEGLRTVVEFCREQGASTHMPRMGAGLAGGDWSKIEAIVERTLGAAGLAVTVYDLPD